MELKTLNYGNIKYTKKDIISFEKPLLGFNELREFVLIELEKNSMFSVLHSIEDNNIGFIVVNPFSIRKDYEIEINDETVANLEIKTHEDVLVLNTVTLNAVPEKITTNLRAPIIINIKNKKGKQIILSNENYDIKTPLTEV